MSKENSEESNTKFILSKININVSVRLKTHIRSTYVLLLIACQDPVCGEGVKCSSQDVLISPSGRYNYSLRVRGTPARRRQAPPLQTPHHKVLLNPDTTFHSTFFTVQQPQLRSLVSQPCHSFWLARIVCKGASQ